MANNTLPLAIGQSTGTAYFNGDLDEVALYNAALSAAQVDSHCKLGVDEAGDPVIGAAGDIACETDDPSYNGGNGTSTACDELATSNLMSGNLLTGGTLAALLPLGDEQYESGAYSQFTQSYGPPRGRYATPTQWGNHEYNTSGVSGYFDYFNGVGNQTRAGRWPQPGLQQLQRRHLAPDRLNSNCSAIGGCGAGSPEETWLKSGGLDTTAGIREFVVARLPEPEELHQHDRRQHRGPRRDHLRSAAPHAPPVLLLMAVCAGARRRVHRQRHH